MSRASTLTCASTVGRCGRTVDLAAYWPHHLRLLDGPSGDYLLRDTRSLVLRHLRDYPGRKPTQIADALNLDPATIRQTCRRMADDGQLSATPAGAYHPTDQPPPGQTGGG